MSPRKYFGKKQNKKKKRKRKEKKKGKANSLSKQQTGQKLSAVVNVYLEKRVEKNDGNSNVANGESKREKARRNGENANDNECVLSFRITVYFSIKHYLFSFLRDAIRYKRVARQLPITLPTPCCCNDERE